MTLKSIAGFALSAVFLGSCSAPNPQETTPEKAVADKPFAPGGNIEMRLEGGSYTIRTATDDQIHVAFGGNVGSARAELTAYGLDAHVGVKDTPNNNFHASIEVPQSSNLVIHLTGGELKIGGISGNKDVDSLAGDVQIAVGDPDDYSSADGSVKAGDIDAGVFGKSKSGLNSHFDWQGHGKYTLHASLGAGNLVLQRQ